MKVKISGIHDTDKKESKQKTSHLISLQLKLRSTLKCLFGILFEAPVELQKAKGLLQTNFCPLLPRVLT